MTMEAAVPILLFQSTSAGASGRQGGASPGDDPRHQRATGRSAGLGRIPGTRRGRGGTSGRIPGTGWGTGGCRRVSVRVYGCTGVRAYRCTGVSSFETHFVLIPIHSMFLE
jgi:hypothetical protein